MINQNSPGMKNQENIQSILTDDLFPAVQHISDVKQVLEFMENVAQPISQEQIRAAILLTTLGDNKRLHEVNPYAWFLEKLVGEKKTGIWKKAVAQTSVYLDTMQELIPKPPRPLIVAPGGGKGGKD